MFIQEFANDQPSCLLSTSHIEAIWVANDGQQQARWFVMARTSSARTVFLSRMYGDKGDADQLLNRVVSGKPTIASITAGEVTDDGVL